jgi:ABC-2 type transport system ATP-binding protein
MTAEEYLRYCGEITGLTPSENRERSSYLLDLVGLGGERHRIRGFSRGMKQRLGIAQALLNKPKLLICDEPTSALDPVGRREILDILLTARQETTVLFSTHILSDVERICTDVALLRNGRLAVSGRLSDIMTRHRSDRYVMETETDGDALLLCRTFPKIRQTDKNEISFSENDHSEFDVLKFVAEKRIHVLKFQREETGLESLFTEVSKG